MPKQCLQIIEKQLAYLTDEALTRKEIEDNQRPLFTPFISIETTGAMRTLQFDALNEEEKTIKEEEEEGQAKQLLSDDDFEDIQGLLKEQK